jgi:hypothetical protein
VCLSLLLCLPLSLSQFVSNQTFNKLKLYFKHFPIFLSYTI